jgi:hypothetical protein
MAASRSARLRGSRSLHRQLALAGAAAALVALAACTTGSVLTLEPAVDVGTQTATVPGYAAQPVVPETAAAEFPAPQAPMPEVSMPDAPISGSGTSAPVMNPVRESSPVMEAAYPRIDNPAPVNVMPADEVDCRSDLKRLGVAYVDLPTIRKGQCGIDYPVKVSAIGSVRMRPAATLTCTMAASFAAWTKRELVPAARLRYWSGVKQINQGSSFSCRNIAGEGVLSEHGKGNALDVMSIELNNGDKIDVRKPGLFSFRQRGFLNTVRADGCSYFTTVLGPGYNYDHRNHFHFDVKNRRNGYRACR